LEQVFDPSRRMSTLQFAGDSAAGDTTTSRTVCSLDDSAVLLRAWFFPTVTGIVANDTTYATFTIRSYNTNGTLHQTYQVTTKLLASGGAGDMAPLVRNDLKIPSGFTVPAGLSIAIGKTGGGVIVPAGVFEFQLSNLLRI